jgi:plastocyanin
LEATGDELLRDLNLLCSFTTDSPRFNKTWSTDETATFTITFPEKGEQIFHCKYHLPENTDYFMAGVLRAAT